MVVVLAIGWVRIIGKRVIGLWMNNIAMSIMLMIMAMSIKSDLGLGVSTKKCQISRIVSHLLRMPVATHMLIKTNHGIGIGHHQMQIMGHQQYATLALLANLVDQVVQRRLPIDINALNGFIQNQQLWITQ